MKPEDSIRAAYETGFCKIRKGTWLWRQCAIADYLPASELQRYPYWLICEKLDKPRGVFGPSDPVLKRACEGVFV